MLLAPKAVVKKDLPEARQLKSRPPIIPLSLPSAAFAPEEMPFFGNKTEGTKLRSMTPEAILLISMPSHTTLLWALLAPPKFKVAMLPGAY